jgi:hypothetical protein
MELQGLVSKYPDTPVWLINSRESIAAAACGSRCAVNTVHQLRKANRGKNGLLVTGSRGDDDARI